MSTKTLFIVVATVATVITGCESLDKGALASGGLAAASAAGKGDRNAQIAIAASAAVASETIPNGNQPSRSTRSAEREQNSSVQRVSASETSTRTASVSAVEQHQKSQQVQPEKQVVAEKTDTVENKPISIAEISDDGEFFEAFKKTAESERKTFYGRALGMKDEKLLSEFIRLCPGQAKDLAEKSYSKIETSELAELIIDNLNGIPLGEHGGWSEYKAGLSDMLATLSMKLDETARTKYVANATKNLENAKKEGVVVFDKYYIGMPVIDHLMVSYQDNRGWVKSDSVGIRKQLEYCADMETDIKGKDWRQAWKIKTLVFPSKERHRYFKVKGTVEGLVIFCQKYLDKSASIKDVNLNNGWWEFRDDEHDVEVSLNDKSGSLQIDRIN